MAEIIPWHSDVVLRPVKFVKADQVYAIIVAEGAYAIANSDKGVTVIETKTDPTVTGRATAALLETSMNVGEDFASIDVTGVALDNPERVYGIVVPKSEEARADWYIMYVVGGFSTMPDAPFLWRLAPMILTEARLIRFKIRYESHIKAPPEGGQPTVPMVQMYPDTDATARQMGWSVLAYRTDREGTAEMFQSPHEWHPDVIDIFGAHGLLFGKDPPLIAADVPFEE